MAGITPLNNFLGPESDPVTAVTQLPKYQSTKTKEEAFMRRVSLETLIESPLTSMTLVFFRLCYMSEVRVTAEAP